MHGFGQRRYRDMHPSRCKETRLAEFVSRSINPLVRSGRASTERLVRYDRSSPTNDFIRQGNPHSPNASPSDRQAFSLRGRELTPGAQLRSCSCRARRWTRRGGRPASATSTGVREARQVNAGQQSGPAQAAAGNDKASLPQPSEKLVGSPGRARVAFDPWRCGSLDPWRRDGRSSTSSSPSPRRRRIPRRCSIPTPCSRSRHPAAAGDGRAEQKEGAGMGSFLLSDRFPASSIAVLHPPSPTLLAHLDGDGGGAERRRTRWLPPPLQSVLR